MTPQERARADHDHDAAERRALIIWLELLRQACPDDYAALVGAQ